MIEEREIIDGLSVLRRAAGVIVFFLDIPLD